MQGLRDRVGACRLCDGLGYLYDNQVVVGQFGETNLCSCVNEACRCGGKTPFQYFDAQFEAHWCPCRPFRLRLIKVQRLFAKSNVPRKYQWKFLDDFHQVGPDGAEIVGAQDLKAMVMSLIETRQRGESPRGILLHGLPGNGKTMLSCVMLNELIFRFATPSKFLDLSLQYFEKLRSTYNEESGRYGQTWTILEELSTVPCLVIDDFGVQRNTEWEQEMLYNLVDTRYEHERLTLVTTNRPYEEIKGLHGGRIYSRLQEMCRVIHVEAPDYREHFDPITRRMKVRSRKAEYRSQESESRMKA